VASSAMAVGGSGKVELSPETIIWVEGGPVAVISAVTI
jgi:hypothetical protein